MTGLAVVVFVVMFAGVWFAARLKARAGSAPSEVPVELRRSREPGFRGRGGF
jgi:heme/copper-type cytochrome/quinol oxidase subunit 2